MPEKNDEQYNAMIVIFMLIAIIIALTAVVKRLNDVNILCPIDELNAY